MCHDSAVAAAAATPADVLMSQEQRAPSRIRHPGYLKKKTCPLIPTRSSTGGEQSRGNLKFLLEIQISLEGICAMNQKTASSREKKPFLRIFRCIQTASVHPNFKPDSKFQLHRAYSLSCEPDQNPKGRKRRLLTSVCATQRQMAEREERLESR